MLASTCWVSAPRRVRLPPHTLRVTTAGRMACSVGGISAAGLRVGRGEAANVEAELHVGHPFAFASAALADERLLVGGDVAMSWSVGLSTWERIEALPGRPKHLIDGGYPDGKTTAERLRAVGACPRTGRRRPNGATSRRGGTRMTTRR